jgi:hypothetical protein
VRTADNLTTFMYRLSINLGVSTSWNPQGLSRPVMGLLYLYLLQLLTTHSVSYYILKCYISIHKKNNEFDLFNFRGQGIVEVMSVHKHHALRA